MNYTKYLLIPIMFLVLSCSKDNDGNSDNNTPYVKTSLPIKVVIKNANNAVTYTSNITYDNQKRIIKTVVVYENSTLNYIESVSYESGKITRIIERPNDLTTPTSKYIYFYDSNGMKNEEYYHNNNLSYITDWYYRPDGGKERRIKSATSGNLVSTRYYRFSAAGNIERFLEDYTSPSDEDIEYTFSNYDNKLRAFASHIENLIPRVMLEINETKLPAPNNPQAYTYKNMTSGYTVSYTMEYTYNNKNQVTVMKIKNAANGELVETRTIEYQEF